MQKIITAPGKNIYLIEVTNKYGLKFIIPVVDVTDGDEERQKGMKMLHDSNRTIGSKFFKPTTSWLGITYNQSTKKQDNGD